MYITCHIILYWVELGGILFLASYNGYYACPHTDSIIIVILVCPGPHAQSSTQTP